MLTGLRPVGPFEVALIAGSIALGIGLMRAALRGGIVVTRSRLVEYGDLHKRTYPTGEIEEFFVAPTPHIVPWYSLWIRLSQHEPTPLEQVRVLGIRPGRSYELLKEAAANGNEWLHGSG